MLVQLQGQGAAAGEFDMGQRGETVQERLDGQGVLVEFGGAPGLLRGLGGGQGALEFPDLLLGEAESARSVVVVGYLGVRVIIRQLVPLFEFLGPQPLSAQFPVQSLKLAQRVREGMSLAFRRNDDGTTTGRNNDTGFVVTHSDAEEVKRRLY
jgi:hypothetical protein